MSADPIVFLIPIQTFSEPNSRGKSWRTHWARTKNQRPAAELVTRNALNNQWNGFINTKGPLIITMTRLMLPRGRRYDDDNNRLALKHIRDGIADALGRNDGDPALTWICKQEPGKGKVGVLVEIKENAAPKT